MHLHIRSKNFMFVFVVLSFAAGAPALTLGDLSPEFSADEPFAAMAAKEWRRLQESSPAGVATAKWPLRLVQDGAFAPDGFRVTATSSEVVVAGRNTGVLYGLYALLRHAGWEFYGPGCETAPDWGVELGSWQLVDAPSFESRIVQFSFAGENAAWRNEFETLRCSYSPYRYMQDKTLSVMPLPNAFDPDDTIDCIHSNYSFAPCTKKNFLEHPELHAKDRQGSLKGFSELYGVTGGPHGCVSSPAYREIAVQKVRRWLAGSPASLTVSVSQGDGYEYCECPTCLALDAVPQPPGQMRQHMSDRQLDLINHVASELGAEFPLHKFIFLVYCSTTEPPERVLPLPNVGFFFCPYPPYATCFSHDLHCPCNAQFLGLWQEWVKRFPNHARYVFDYPQNYSNRFIAFYPHDGIADKIRFYLLNGVSGVYLCGTPRLLEDLFIYRTGKLLWRPEMSADDLLACDRCFLSAWYGPAASAMEEYLTLIQTASKKLCQGIYGAHTPLGQADFLGPARAILEQAERFAGPGVHMDRIHTELAIVLYTDITHFATKGKGKRLAMLKRYRELCRESHNRIKPSHTTDIQSWLVNGFGLHITSRKEQKWYDAPEFSVLDACNTADDFDALAATLLQPARLTNQTYVDNAIVLSPSAFQVTGIVNAPAKYMGRNATLLYGGEECLTTFENESSIPHQNGMIVIDGLDHDKSGKTTIELSINGHVVFSRPNTASKEVFTPLAYSVPEGLVREGLNSIRLRNLSPPAPVANWFAVAGMSISPFKPRWETVIAGEKLSCHRSPAAKDLQAEWQTLPQKTTLHVVIPSDSASHLEFYTRGITLEPGVRHRAIFTLTGDASLAVPAFILEVAPPWNSVNKVEKYVAAPEGREYRLEFHTRTPRKSCRLEFWTAALPPNSKLEISDVRIEREANNE